MSLTKNKKHNNNETGHATIQMDVTLGPYISLQTLRSVAGAMVKVSVLMKILTLRMQMDLFKAMEKKEDSSTRRQETKWLLIS